MEETTMRAQLFNPTTGEYLNSAGQWQSSQTWALTDIDNSISAPGLVGLGRPALYTGTATFDDFSVALATNLGTSTPSYYGLSVTPGEDGQTVDLVRVNNGTSTTLAELKPASTYISNYFSNQWIEATLYVDGPSIRAQIYRADTGQYLNGEDLWQSTPTNALNVTDTSLSALTGPGFGGLARLAGSTGTVYFDNLAWTPLSAANAPPSVSLTAPSGTLTGNVTVTATPSSNIGIAKVDFYVEDNAGTSTPTILTHWEELAGASYSWNWVPASSPTAHTHCSSWPTTPPATSARLQPA